MDRYLTHGQVVEKAVDGEPCIFIQKGEALESHRGTRTSTGIYAFTDISKGPVFVKFGTQYIVTRADTVDLGKD